MDTIEVKYSSYAIAPVGISVSKTYKFGKDKSGYFISDIHGNKYMDVSEIKSLFSPITGSWEEKKENKTIEK